MVIKKIKKGVILCGGNGTRLRPLTLVANKHLLSIYNKPMILYPIETLKSFGIQDILIISGGEHIGRFAEYLGDGSNFDITLTYKVQKEAAGIAQALSLAENFADGEGITAILGDNIFENTMMSVDFHNTATIYLKEVEDPERFGVAVFAENEYLSPLIAIEEKPKIPKSKFAVTGLYYFPSDVFDVIRTLKPSQRGELEIAEVNDFYVKARRCSYQKLTGFWSDAGTFDSMLNASNWIKSNKK